MSQNLPPHIRDFFNKAAPSESPVDELQNRYDERVKESRRGTGSPMPRHDSVDYIVEFRIREWMMRVQKEQEDERKRKEWQERLNRPHAPNSGPPKGPAN